MRALYLALQGVPDLRCKRGRRYSAALVLTLLLVAKMAGEQTIAGIADWVMHHKERLQQWLPLERTLCANTYREICAHVDAQALLKALSVVPGAATAAALLQEPDARPATVDPGSFDPEPKRLLRHYDVASGRTEAFLPIEGKGVEPKTLRMWLAAQGATPGAAHTHSAANTLTGCLLTADALHTQNTVCRAMRMAGADYLLLVKHNQRQLHEEIGYLFSQPPDFWFPERRAQTVEAGHGRIQVRTLRASDELNAYLADRWPGVRQVFQIERTVTRCSRQGTHTTVEVVYGLTSVAAREAPPEQLLAWVQAHWHIENRNHWRRDATLGEERLQLSCKPAALVIAALNCILPALFDHLRHPNCRKAMRLYNAHPDQALALLCQPL